MNSKKMDSGSKDIISSLPDALIGHILSFLSTKDAALTSVLSQRWRFLLAFVSNLDLDNLIDDHPEMSNEIKQHKRTSFIVFVDRVMVLQGNAPLNKFSLGCEIERDPSIVNGWILNVLERGVVDLDLYIASEYDFRPPPKVLMSKTLVRLKLAGTRRFAIDVGEVFPPKLKTLHIDNVMFEDMSGAAFAKLISGCPVLEELVMIGFMISGSNWESFSLSNQTLKRLTIHYNVKSPKSVSFDTPNLVYLECSNAMAVKYPKFHFDSLVEASIGLRMTSSMIKDAADFLIGITNVKILYLTSHTLTVLTYRCKAIPVFNNLIHLTIETNKDVRWESLPSLLEKCPNLETLVFEGLHYKDTNLCTVMDTVRCVCKPWTGIPVCLSSSPVKILKILKFGELACYKDDINKQRAVIKYFLETMPNLEQVIIDCKYPIDHCLKIVSTELQMFVKAASPKCKIQVISNGINK